MSQDLNPYSSDRILVIQDERERIIAFEDFQLVPPSVGIFDEPTRCYRINKEWAKLMTGAVSILLEIGVWKYAEHEGYSAIQQISDFLDGLECPPDMIVEDIRVNGCNIEAFINGVWVSKGSVLSCVTGVTGPMQTQINTNTNNIASNQSAITANANNISQNDIDIDALELDATQQALLIQANADNIAVNASDIDTLQLNIAQNNGILSDHEQRIVTLENASGGGGGLPAVPVTMRVEEHIESSIIGSFFDMQDFMIPSGYDEIRVYMRTKNEENLTYIYAQINDNWTLADYRSNNGATELNTPAIARFNLVAVETDGWFNVEIVFPFASKNQRQSAIAYGTYSADINSQNAASIWTWSTDFVANGIQKLRIATQHTCDAGTEIHVFGIKLQDVYVLDSTPQPTVVTFDAGGLSYTLPVGQSGTVAAGGNTGDCLQAADLLDQDYIAVEVDLGSPQSISNVKFDRWLQEVGFNDGDILLLADGILKSSLNPNTVGLPSQWVSVDWLARVPAIFPFSATTLQLWYKSKTVNASEARLDNFEVIT